MAVDMAGARISGIEGGSLNRRQRAVERAAVSMIPAEISVGRRARLCVTDDGHGYFYGTIAEIDSEHVVMQMDSGAIILVPWWELVATDAPPKALDPVDKLASLLTEQLLFPDRRRPFR